MKKLTWKKVAQNWMKIANNFETKLYNLKQKRKTVQRGAVAEFIATYLIPEYERTYIDAKLRSDFMEIVDKAELDMHEDLEASHDL